METPHIVLKTNLVLQLIQELQIKSKTVMSWSSGKKKDGIFCTAYFVRRKFYLTFVFFFQCKVYCIPFQNIHTFTYQKVLLHTLLLKIVKSLQCILKVTVLKNNTLKAFGHFKNKQQSV